MAFALFQYLSPRSRAKIARQDGTILPVYEDPPLKPVLNTVIADGEIFLSRNQKTRNQFRPRAGKGGVNSYQLRQYAEVTLGGGSLRKVVKLPEGEDENEWLAVNSEFPADACYTTTRMLTENVSGGLLQPNQSPLRRHHRVLLASVMSRDEGYG
jgi:hypothetical protein